MGLFWTLFNPLLQIMIYVVVFASILGNKFDTGKGDFPYWLYLCAGLLPWIAFQEAVTRATVVYLENSNLVKKVFFPAEILPAYVTLGSFINLSISLAIFSILLVVLGAFPGPVFLLLPALVLIQQIATFGFALCFSVLNVFFRDLAQLVQVLLMVWFWGTPICYPKTIIDRSDLLPVWLQYLYNWNPFYRLINAYRDILMAGVVPNWEDIVWFLIFSLSVFLVGKILFRTQMKEIVDLV